MSNKKHTPKPKINNEKKKLGINKFLLFIAIFLGLSSIYLYKLVATPPELPKIDDEQWWGAYPIDMKQEKDDAIRPYNVEFSDVIVNDLRERLLHRRPFTPPLDNAGFTYGFNTNFLTKVLDFWQNSYNFKERELFFNKYEHYLTKLQGLDIHFVHVKPVPNDKVTVVPIILLHGWPGSFREFYEIIPKLVTPRPDQDFVFEVIVPSIPGFGYSQAPVRSGMGFIEIAVIFNKLMQRIGHNKYYVQGGNFGHAIGSALATIFPERVLGFHTNMPIVGYSNPFALGYMLLGALWPSLVVEDQQADRIYPLSKEILMLIEETGYYHIQATKPDTVGIALTDSPAGLVAYLLEKFSTWTNRAYRQASDGGLLHKFSLTHLLDNVMVYWASNSVTTSMRLYTEGYKEMINLDRIPTVVPTCGIKFKHELLFRPDVVLKTKYTNYLHSTVVEDGGHFAALESPGVLADDVFLAVGLFRKFHGHSNQSSNPITDEATETASNPARAKSIYEFTVKDIKGNEIKLDKYKGNVLIIVNVASQCGYTNTHYTQLNELYEKYENKGLRILAFPCNQFGNQEPGTLQHILQFTQKKNVKFDLFEKVDVNGDNAHPLWQYLKNVKGGTLGDFIKWNFSKFIINRNGVPVERFGPNVNPVDLEPYLEKYW